MRTLNATLRSLLMLTALLGATAGVAAAQDPDFTSNFDREHCTFTASGSNPYFPLWPGYTLRLEGEEEDDEGQMVELSSQITVLGDTERVDGVTTRVLEEREEEDGELIEISRNYYATCRETGDVWYFGEAVDIYEDGEIVSHDGAWRAGVDGAEPGIIMPGNPLVGARYFQEVAPGVALDRSEVLGFEDEATVPAGSFHNVLKTLDTSELIPGDEDEKLYAPGVGIIVDAAIELVEITPPPCLPDATTLCLNDGRFKVQADWTDPQDNEGVGMAILPSDDSGEFWFFSPDNTEILVKVIDACGLPEFNSFWVFAAGLTNVELTIELTDTVSGQMREYDNDQGQPFEPVLDTSAFTTCP
jgi:hypothetical protein